MQNKVGRAILTNTKAVSEWHMGWRKGRKMCSKIIFAYQVHLQLGGELERWTTYCQH